MLHVIQKTSAKKNFATGNNLLWVEIKFVAKYLQAAAKKSFLPPIPLFISTYSSLPHIFPTFVPVLAYCGTSPSESEENQS